MYRKTNSIRVLTSETPAEQANLCVCGRDCDDVASSGCTTSVINTNRHDPLVAVRTCDRRHHVSERNPSTLHQMNLHDGRAAKGKLKHDKTVAQVAFSTKNTITMEFNELLGVEFELVFLPDSNPQTKQKQSPGKLRVTKVKSMTFEKACVHTK